MNTNPHQTTQATSQQANNQSQTKSTIQAKYKHLETRNKRASNRKRNQKAIKPSALTNHILKVKTNIQQLKQTTWYQTNIHVSSKPRTTQQQLI